MYWKEGMTMAVSVKVRLTERTVYARPLKKIGAGEQDEAARRFTDAVNKGILKGAPEGDVWEITDLSLIHIWNALLRKLDAL